MPCHPEPAAARDPYSIFEEGFIREGEKSC